jgi:hypothetical protein
MAVIVPFSPGLSFERFIVDLLKKLFSHPASLEIQGLLQDRF